MSNKIDLNQKLMNPDGMPTQSLGEAVTQALKNSPHGGEGLEKMKLADRIERRMNDEDGMIELTAKEVTMIEGSLNSTRTWAYEQIIKEIDPALWNQVMFPDEETEDSEEE